MRGSFKVLNSATLLPFVIYNMCKDSQGSQTPIQMIPEKVVFSLFDFVVEVLLLLLVVFLV